MTLILIVSIGWSHLGFAEKENKKLPVENQKVVFTKTKDNVREKLKDDQLKTKETVFYMTDNLGNKWYDKDRDNLERWVDHMNKSSFYDYSVYKSNYYCAQGRT